MKLIFDISDIEKAMQLYIDSTFKEKKLDTEDTCFWDNENDCILDSLEFHVQIKDDEEDLPF